MGPEPEVSRDPENGYLFVDRERTFSFRIKTFQAALDRLDILAGKPVSQVIADQMGRAIGQAGLAYWKGRIHSGEDLWKVADEVLSVQGAGRCVGGEKRVEGSTSRFIFRLKGTLTSYDRKTTEPSCHIMRGIVQGWIEGYLERKATSSIEKQCEAAGSSECVFEVTFTQ